MNYLGLDYGTQRIGLALGSDETSAVPYRTLEIFPQRAGPRRRAVADLGLLIDELTKIIINEQIDVVVVGRPQSMINVGVRTDPPPPRLRRTGIEEQVLEFVEKLRKQISIPIYLEDERLTSKGADAMKKEFGGSGQRDAVAAMLILDSYLERKKNISSS